MLDLVIAILMATLPPCPTEDSQWCTWDAQTQGNGLGTSFVSFDNGVQLRVGARGLSEAQDHGLSEDFRIEH